MPYRDLLVHWVVLSFFSFIAVLALYFSIRWIAFSAAVPLLFALFNLVLYKRPIFPYDCILSAHSTDGINWVRDEGVRVDVGGMHNSSQVYYPEVVPIRDGGYRMYFRGGADKSVILSAISQDGMSWREERGYRLGLREGWERIMAPEIISFDGKLRIYFTALEDGYWKIYCSESLDGIEWGKEQCCIDRRDEEGFLHVIDPSVIKVGDSYRMYCTCFSAGESNIYMCESDGGVKWSALALCTGYRGLEASYVRNPNIVAIENKKWRMYFAESDGLSALNSRIASAVSSDGLVWTREEGYRLVPGGPCDGQGVFCPDVLPISQGWKMYYGGYWKKHWLAPYTHFRHRLKPV